MPHPITKPLCMQFIFHFKSFVGIALEFHHVCAQQQYPFLNDGHRELDTLEAKGRLAQQSSHTHRHIGHTSEDIPVCSL